MYLSSTGVVGEMRVEYRSQAIIGTRESGFLVRRRTCDAVECIQR